MDLSIGSVVPLFTVVLLASCDARSILLPCALSKCPRDELLDIESCGCANITQLPVNPNLPCSNLLCSVAIYPCKSYKTDSRRCRTCKCNCSTSMCPNNCRHGTEYTKDRQGCQVCQCKSQEVGHVYQNRPCGAFCPNGLQVDQFGCQLCRCRSKKCGALCRNFCPHGRIMDSDGCPTCTCNDNPGRPLIPF